jgi:hypothetical protein
MPPLKMIFKKCHCFIARIRFKWPDDFLNELVALHVIGVIFHIAEPPLELGRPVLMQVSPPLDFAHRISPDPPQRGQVFQMVRPGIVRTSIFKRVTIRKNPDNETELCPFSICDIMDLE